VIGGSGAVGSALVRELAAQGASVGLTYKSGARVADALTGELGVVARSLDLRTVEAIGPCLDEIVSSLGGLDAMVYCAAVGSTVEPAIFDGLDDVTLRGWETLMAVNVTGAFFASRHVARVFAAGGGNIVLMGSVDGVKPLPAPVPYAVSKAALRGMALSLAKSLGPRNVRVNVVAPGVLESGASRTLPDDLRAEYLKHCGLRRYGRIDEVTSVVSWLALENSYVTGQTVVVDGGL
jgi:NAD(P)-dependent dehydrogenase (short-subunit alcohol dehydrogenase family)